MSPSFYLFFLAFFVAHWCTKSVCSFFFTHIQTEDTAFEPNKCQINIAAREHTFRRKQHTQRDAVPDPGCFCFLPNTGWMAACHSSCQNLWEMLFTSLCSSAPNNNSGMRRSNPQKRKQLCLHAKQCTDMYASGQKTKNRCRIKYCSCLGSILLYWIYSP